MQNLTVPIFVFFLINLFARVELIIYVKTVSLHLWCSQSNKPYMLSGGEEKVQISQNFGHWSSPGHD
jgi:hypothetical protein